MNGRRNQGRAETARAALGDLPAQLAALQGMTVAQLRDRWLALYGTPTASRNGPYLRKRLAWRVQEIAEGGLTQRARDRIEQILDGHFLPDITRRARAATDGVAPKAMAAPPASDRDPRLPPVGTVLRKVHRGTEHLVTVLDDGFEHQGRRFGTLSAVAKAITGAGWNGYLYFGLASRSGGARKVA